MIALENNYFISYDKLTDTLYITLGKPRPASSSMDINHILIRTSKTSKEVCGLTILDYKERYWEESWNDYFILKHLPEFPIYEANKIMNKGS